MRLRALPFVLPSVLIAAFPGAGTAAAAEPLSIAQVEKVTGLKGLSVKPAKYDKVARNFVNAENEIAVSVKVAGASVYEVWKSQPSFPDQVALSGLGEDAITSKQGRYICFKKATAGVCVTGMFATGGKPALVGDAALLELARLAAATL